MFFDADERICYKVVMYYNLAKPVNVVVVADSHTTIHGSVGAFAVGAGNTDAAFALTTGKLWLKVPESIKVSLKNRLAPGVFSKDIALALIKDLGTDGANYVAVEYHGELKPKLSPALRGRAYQTYLPKWVRKPAIFPVEPFTPDNDAT